MKIRIIIFCLTTIWMSSCKMGDHTKASPAIAKDTLNYAYKTIEQRAADCGTKADSNCTIARIKYPVFSTENALNDSVRRKLSTIFQHGDKTDTGLMQVVKAFVNNYEQSKKDNHSAQNYTLDCYTRVLRQDSNLVTLQFGGYTFQGGAHPSEYTGFFNWNTKTNKEITLSDLFINDYQERLKSIADTIFRKNEKLAMNAPLANDYFFKNNKFALNGNYSITPLGIRFFYNQYEIKPYAAGTTDLFIPYAKIKSLLRPNTVVAQYLK